MENSIIADLKDSYNILFDVDCVSAIIDFDRNHYSYVECVVLMTNSGMAEKKNFLACIPELI